MLREEIEQYNFKVKHIKHYSIISRDVLERKRQYFYFCRAMERCCDTHHVIARDRLFQ